MAHAAGHQGPVGLRVRAVAGLLHVLEDQQRHVQGVVVDAGAHEARPHLRVGREAVAPGQGVHGLEGPVELPAAAVHLHQDAQGEVRGHNVVLLHVLQELVGQVHAAVAGAAVQHGVVDDGVACHLVLLHAAEDLEGLVQVAADAVALYNGGVGDGIRLAAVRSHGLDQLRNLVHAANAGLEPRERHCTHVHEPLRRRLARQASQVHQGLFEVLAAQEEPPVVQEKHEGDGEDPREPLLLQEGQRLEEAWQGQPSREEREPGLRQHHLQVNLDALEVQEDLGVVLLQESLKLRDALQHQREPGQPQATQTPHERLKGGISRRASVAEADGCRGKAHSLGVA
mmetsp:Transcript_37323/g.115972  ORF Transcript_37323/g.115972 Transcript_37323/m.115972 type:complete len:341 (-) Transcript_37323:1039-2061(-)